MSDTNNNGGQSEVTRTDSNLPILFANGYPTSLKNMKLETLELFLPFLVQCSKEYSDESESDPPRWWPRDVPYKFPMVKPNRLKKEVWEEKLKRVVENCYKSSDNEYLLTYSESLSEIETEKLRYITVNDMTTSLYKKENEERKLLLTFRNENMLYDKKKRMQLWHREQSTDMICASPEPEEAEATFLIILCDYCDSEFYSDEALEIHEAKCRDRVDSDQEPDTKIVENIIISDDDDDDDDEDSTSLDNFMSYFALTPNSRSEPVKRRLRSISPKKMSPKKKSHQKKKIVVNKKEIEKERTVPFSSPAGLLLTKKRNKDVTQSYIEQKLDEISSFCKAKPFMKLTPRSRMSLQVRQCIQQQLSDNPVFDEMRVVRHYSWPRKSYGNRFREISFNFLNRSLINQMSPAFLRVKMITPYEIKMYQEELRRIREEKKRREAELSVVVLDSSDDDENYPPIPSTSYETQQFIKSRKIFKSEISIRSFSGSSQLSFQGLKRSLECAEEENQTTTIKKWIETVSNPNCVMSNTN